MAAEDAEVEVPPTLKALLAARLDQLDEAERRVLERGSVEGEIFHRGGVQALAPEETQVTTRLAALVRRQLVRPDRAQIAGDDGYRFRHLLIRDAAYDALPKAVRADLHARFADWLDEHGQALVERDEIVGYHLEQAARYRAELGQPDAALAERAAARLAAAGRRASDRLDYRAALALLTGRSSSCARTGSTSRSSSRRPGAWRISMGARRAETAERSPNAPRRRATAPGRCSLARWPSSCATLRRRRRPRPTSWRQLCRAALPLEEERGDPRRLALLWELLASAANFRMQNDEHVEAAARRRSATPASPATRPRTRGLDWALILGPRPADEAMRVLDELADRRPPGAHGPRAGGAARDARPHRRGVAARGGAVEPPARGDRRHFAGTPRLPLR